MCIPFTDSKKHVNTTLSRFDGARNQPQNRSFRDHGQCLTAVFTREKISKSQDIEVHSQSTPPCSHGIHFAFIERHGDWSLSATQSESNPALPANRRAF